VTLNPSLNLTTKPGLDFRSQSWMRRSERVSATMDVYSPSSTSLHPRSRRILTYLSSPSHTVQDASWVLPAGSPLKCTSPADVYLLLKSSDFVTHDLSPSSVFEGCHDGTDTDVEEEPVYQLELVLRKWYSVDPSRELRCFVRHNSLIGMQTYPFPTSFPSYSL